MSNDKSINFNEQAVEEARAMINNALQDTKSITDDIKEILRRLETTKGYDFIDKNSNELDVNLRSVSDNNSVLLDNMINRIDTVRDAIIDYQNQQEIESTASTSIISSKGEAAEIPPEEGTHTVEITAPEAVEGGVIVSGTAGIVANPDGTTPGFTFGTPDIPTDDSSVLMKYVDPKTGEVYEYVGSGSTGNHTYTPSYQPLYGVTVVPKYGTVPTYTVVPKYGTVPTWTPTGPTAPLYGTRPPTWPAPPTWTPTITPTLPTPTIPPTWPTYTPSPEWPAPPTWTPTWPTPTIPPTWPTPLVPTPTQMPTPVEVYYGPSIPPTMTMTITPTWPTPPTWTPPTPPTWTPTITPTWTPPTWTPTITPTWNPPTWTPTITPTVPYYTLYGMRPPTYTSLYPYTPTIYYIGPTPVAVLYGPYIPPTMTMTIEVPTYLPQDPTPEIPVQPPTPEQPSMPEQQPSYTQPSYTQPSTQYMQTPQQPTAPTAPTTPTPTKSNANSQAGLFDNANSKSYSSIGTGSTSTSGRTTTTTTTTGTTKKSNTVRNVAIGSTIGLLGLGGLAIAATSKKHNNDDLYETPAVDEDRYEIDQTLDGEDDDDDN